MYNVFFFCISHIFIYCFPVSLSHILNQTIDKETNKKINTNNRSFTSSAQPEQELMQSAMQNTQT